MRSSAANPLILALAERFAEPLIGESGADLRTADGRNRQTKERSRAAPVRGPIAVPERTNSRIGESGKAAPVRGLIAAFVTVALVPMAILIVILWPGAIRYQHADSTPTPAQGGPASEQATTTVPLSKALPEIALTSPDMIEAKAGEEVDFAIAVDSEKALPASSLIAISAMPDGASFSQGRPYGVTGWSLRPDEIGELRLRLPKTQGGASDMHIELLAADGTQLAQSETRLNIAADPVGGRVVSAVESDPFQQIAQAAEAPKPTEALPPPQRKPVPSANTEPSVKVATVKVVTIKPAWPTRPPHNGALALGEAAEAPAEWVEIVRAVDVHARPQQSSETVKVAEKGLKLRVTARDKNWVQVSDPATSTKGWIYRRFLKPTEPPA
jgi:hypothetical protein